MNIEKDYIKFMHYTVGSANHPECKVEFTMSTNNNIDGVLEEFQKFLKGVGFDFDGELTITQE